MAQLLLAGPLFRLNLTQRTCFRFFVPRA